MTAPRPDAPPVVKTRTFTGTCKKGHKVVVARKVGDRWEQVPCGECGALSSHPRGKPSGEGALPTGGTRGDSATTRRPRSGSDTEALLATQLSAAGYFDTTHAERPEGVDPLKCFRREQPWGLRLAPERGFRGDVMFLAANLKVEVVGMSHAAKRSNVAGDVTRDGLSASVGIRTLPVSPEDVRDGTAVQLVARALGRNE